MMLVSHAYFTYANDSEINLGDVDLEQLQLIEIEYSEQVNQANYVEKMSNGQLLKAIRFGYALAQIQPLVQEVKRRVASGALNPQDNASEPQGVTLLEALVCPKAQCSLLDIQDLVQRGADVKMKIGITDDTLLYCLPILEVAQYLIEQGVDCHTLNSHGNTALHIASQYARTDLVKLLLDQGLNVNQKNKSGETPLHMVVAACHFSTSSGECIDILLEHGAELHITNDKKSITPLSMVRKPSFWFDERNNIVKWLEKAQLEIGSCTDENKK